MVSIMAWLQAILILGDRLVELQSCISGEIVTPLVACME